MDKTLLVPHPQTAVSDAMDVYDLLTDWHRSLQLDVAAGDLSANTQNAYQRGMRKFMTWCEEADMNGVTAKTIQQWKADLRQQEYKPNTINAWFAGVRAFFAWAHGNRRLLFNPTEGVKGAKRKGINKKHRRETLTDNEVKRVLSAPDTNTDGGKRDKAILCLMAYTAVRTVEIPRADVADVQTRKGKLILAIQGKGRDEKDEIVVLTHPVVENAIHDWLSVRGDKSGALFVSLSRVSYGQRLASSSIRNMVKGYFRQAGVTSANKTTHSLRHTAITKAIANNAPIQKVKEMARHQSIETTMVYYHELDRIENPAEAFVDYG